MTYLSTPLIATGWEKTLVNDSEGNTILLMPNAHKGLDAVKEATALFAAAPAMFIALESMVLNYAQTGRVTDKFVKEVAQILEGIVACQTK